MNLSRTNSVFLRASALAGAALFAFAAVPAAAQENADREREERPRGRLITIGAGAQFGPEFPGADSYAITPMPIIDVRRPDQRIAFEAADEGWGFGLLGREARFNVGPAIQFQGKRDEDDVGAAVGNVGFTVEAGAFVEAYLSDSFRIRAEGRRGIGGHEAWVGDVGVDFIARGGDTTVFGIGPRVRLADDKYMNAYFGVSPATAVTTGLAAFTPESGVYAAGGAASIRHHFGADGKWGVHGYARYDRLVGDAADSPIVRSFGSRDQFSAGLGLSYTFRTGGAARR
ncbi:MAG TPA: MipA/OmpV family protein [Allosphingosinicella sp.]|jgi:outer membrane protein